MSGLVDFATATVLPDWPLEDDTGVDAQDDGFTQPETIAMGIADCGRRLKDS